jgi:glucose-6-phosphate isomerase
MSGWRPAGGRGAGFVRLPGDEAMRPAVQEVADSFGQWFEDLVVVGIGGSSLGARAVTDALLGPHWNDDSDEAREHYPRLHFLENPDPGSVAELLAGWIPGAPSSTW